MRDSIRARLLLGALLGTLAVLLLASCALYGITRESLRQAFDDALLARALSLASLVEYEDAHLEFEIEDRAMPEFSRSDRPEYFQIWRADGSVLRRSASLGESDLQLPGQTTTTVVTGPVLLPDRRNGRGVTIETVARAESAGIAAPNIRVAVAKDTADLERQLAGLARLLVLIAFLTLLVTGAVLTVVIWAGLRPLSRLTEQIAGLSADNLSSRIVLPGAPAELYPVMEVCNGLLGRLQTVVDRERSFTADVAHELRTPLAGLRSTLEVALSRPRGLNECRSAMNACLDITGQMQGMTANLLSLARLERNQVEAQCKPLLLQELLSECWEALALRAEQKRVTVTWAVRPELTVKTDRDLLRQILVNLLENAVNYVNSGGDIHIASASGSQFATLRVSNTGSRIAADDAARVFERFWRGDASRDGGGAHVGLGLSLVRRLALVLGGAIDATSQRHGLFEITLRLPLSKRQPAAAVKVQSETQSESRTAKPEEANKR